MPDEIVTSMVESSGLGQYGILGAVLAIVLPALLFLVYKLATRPPTNGRSIPAAASTTALLSAKDGEIELVQVKMRLDVLEKASELDTHLAQGVEHLQQIRETILHWDKRGMKVRIESSPNA